MIRSNKPHLLQMPLNIFRPLYLENNIRRFHHPVLLSNKRKPKAMVMGCITQSVGQLLILFSNCCVLVKSSFIRFGCVLRVLVVCCVREYFVLVVGWIDLGLEAEYLL